MIPAPLSEHATHLKYKASTLQEFTKGNNDSKLKKIIQWSYIEPFVISVIKLVKRVLNQPETAQIAADLKALI